MVNLSPIFTKNQHLVDFSPIMKVSIQRIKKRNFNTYYFLGVLAYVVISKCFIWKLIICRFSSGKTIILRISLIRVLNHFWINYIRLKLLLRMYLKEMFLLSCCSWALLCFKFERSFKNYLLINWRPLI